MQETHHSCFGSKKRSTILRQTKIGKHECTCFCLTKGPATFFQPVTIVARLLHFMVLFFIVLLNHSSKCQFLVLHCQSFDALTIIYISLMCRRIMEEKQDVMLKLVQGMIMILLNLYVVPVQMFLEHR